MASLLERLRDALAPRYEVEAVVATGGMATVFRARDTSLDRIVAIKVLSPHLATAAGEERFVREARTLASFSHPNMVTIHDTGEADGLFYYVMDFVTGDTLDQRLESGPLSGREAYTLGRDLLDALGRLHETGVVHRDIKPSNVFLVEGRALLADFGVAHVERPGFETLTGGDGPSPGTPAYMAPELTAGELGTPRTDLYSLGLVLYEAMSGERWTPGVPPEDGDWSRIPRVARPVLRRALAIDPHERWPDADSFRAVLRTRRPGIRVPAWVAALVVMGGGALAAYALSGGFAPGLARAARLDLAVFPCEASDPADSALARSVAQRVSRNLDEIPGISKARFSTASSLYERRAGEVVPSDWTDGLNASHAVRCEVRRSDAGLDVLVRVLNASGAPVDERRLPIPGASAADLQILAALEMSMHVIGVIAPDLKVTRGEVDALAAYPWTTTRPFFWGEDALRRGAWKTARSRYEESLAADPSFTLARLRLAEVNRWLADRPIDEDLAAILVMDLASLSRLDSLLLEAGTRPHGPAQFAAYRAILDTDEYRFDGYTTLLYADELYHRGALWGVPLDSAVALLEVAVLRDSSLVPAVEHLTQALIRTGRREEAEAVLEHLRRVHAPRNETDVYYPDVWQQGFDERFEPARAVRNRPGLAAEGIGLLSLYTRWVRYIDNPATQEALGEGLLAVADRQRFPELSAQGFVAQGLGLIGQGRITAGIAAFDSAASRLSKVETALQAAEWRIVPFALGIEGFLSRGVEEAAGVLAAVWDDPDASPWLRARAATALALLARQRGIHAELARWGGRLDSLALEFNTAAARPSRYVTALESAARGDYRAALDETALDLAYDSAGLASRPFLRSALYWKRGEWYRNIDLPDSAVASWLWHENTDLEGTIPPYMVQAGEVDGALGVHARVRIAQTSTDPDMVCSRAREIARLWRSPDETLALLASQNAERLRECAP